MENKLLLHFLIRAISRVFRSVAARIVLILALCTAPCALSQTPQGFNYQAIARDASGTSIPNTLMPVRISIQSDSLGGTIFWQELHAGVTTNSYGLITLVAGKGTRITGLAKFSDIDWSVTPKFIKTEIDYGGWKNMGSSKLWSVPYSLVAEELSGSVKRLTVTGETESMEEALFEVKNRTGQTVFAVYNEGVRVYVSDGDAKGIKGGFAVGGFGTDKAESAKYMFVGKDSVRIYLDTDPLTKKIKGGFAVGGYDLTKSATQNYLEVSADSIRMYIDDTGKGIKGGFAVGGFDLVKDGNNDSYLNISTDASGIINPAENRILWYPVKNAFLTGRIKIEKPDSVGENSFASGYESKAKGQYSQALGYQAIARGDYSTAIGKNAVADKNNSFSFGEDARAINTESYAIGRGAIARGYRSFAFGSAGVDEMGNPTVVAQALGDYSFAIGQGSIAAAKGSYAIGIRDSARGMFSTAFGYGTSARGDFSTTMGIYTMASGYGSIAMGNSNTATGSYSTASGYHTRASGISSFASGSNTQATNSNATAMGNGSKATAYTSTAMGYASEAISEYSTAIGLQTHATASGSMALGSNTIAEGSYSIALGNGARASGNSSVAIGVGNTASAQSSISMGYQTYARSLYEMVVGCHNVDYTPLAPTGFNDLDRIFVVGTGSNNVYRKNALTVLKNGRMGLQTVVSPIYALELPNNSNIGIGQARAYAWATYSDGRNKSKQAALSYGLEEIMQLMPSEYFHHSTLNEKDGLVIQTEGKQDIGLIAQDVYIIIPEAVNKPENDEKELWSISYDKLVPVLVNAIQEQQQQIESQQQENRELKSDMQSLKAEMEALKALIRNNKR